MTLNFAALLYVTKLAFAYAYISRISNSPFVNEDMDKAIQEIFRLENKEVPPVLRNKLSDVHELIPLFLRSDTTFVRYVEYHQENGALAIDLCAVPFDLPQCVYDALWREQKPAILTSGTLAVGEDFTHTEQQFGLDRGTSLRTLRIPSPFHYENNCLLYFPATHRKKAPSTTKTTVCFIFQQHTERRPLTNRIRTAWPVRSRS